MARQPRLELPPVHPNAGLQALYRKKLQAEIDAMAKSFAYWIKAAYRKNEPAVMALDAIPARELQDVIDRLTRQWRSHFNVRSDELARWFGRAAYLRSDRQLQVILRNAGFSVQFQMTKPMRDILQATVQANVQLIKSIPEQFLTQVQGSVMRSVTAGRDLSGLTKELQQHFGVTRKRAVLIARDQNNKATSALQRARQLDLGIDEGVWLHSHGGKEPRPTHVKQSGKRFKIAEGWFDPDPKVRRRIMPGELIECKCVWKPVVKGFS